MKLFTVPEITFKSHSRSSAMSSFIRLHGLRLKSRLHLFIAEMTLKVKPGHNGHLVKEQFNRLHITFY